MEKIRKLSVKIKNLIAKAQVSQRVKSSACKICNVRRVFHFCYYAFFILLQVQVSWGSGLFRESVGCFVDRSIRKQFFLSCCSPFSQFSTLKDSDFQVIAKHQLNKYLNIPDLTDPKNRIHALNLATRLIQEALEHSLKQSIFIDRGVKIHSVEEEFDKLFIPFDSPMRSAEYARYITEGALLRTHMTPIMPKALNRLKENNQDSLVLMCPGICYVRSKLEKGKVNEPHKIDIWQFSKGKKRLGNKDLVNLVEILLRAFFPKVSYKAQDANHPYTYAGKAIEIRLKDNQKIKILEAGEASPRLFQQAGLSVKDWSGIGIGLGLDKLVMAAKGRGEIRYLRSKDPYVVDQMKNLAPFIPQYISPTFSRQIALQVPHNFTNADLSDFLHNIPEINTDILEEALIMKHGTQYSLESSQTPFKEITVGLKFNSLCVPLNEASVDVELQKVIKAGKQLKMNKL